MVSSGTGAIFRDERVWLQDVWPNQRLPSPSGRLLRCWAAPAPSCPPALLQECCVWVGWLPADGQQADDNDSRGELVHAFLDHDAVNGPAGVVGQEGLTCGDRAGSVGSPRPPSGLTQPKVCSSGACLSLLWLSCQPDGTWPSWKKTSGHGCRDFLDWWWQDTS